MGRQVFFDASGARTRWTTRAIILASLLLLSLTIVFAATVITIPRPEPLALSVERQHLRAVPAVPPQKRRPHFSNRLAALPVRGPDSGKAVRVGFYVPWDDTSGASLTEHLGALDWLVAGLISVTGPDHQFQDAPDPRLEAALAAHRATVSLFPMVQNAREEDWDGPGAAAMLRDSHARATLLRQIEASLAAHDSAGAVFDLQELPASAQPDYLRLLAEARVRFAPHKWLMMVTQPANAANGQLRAFAQATDRVIVKGFDEHGPEGAAGPIAGQPWFAALLKRAVIAVKPERLIMAVGSFGYDWHDGEDAEQVSVEEAWLNAHDSEATILFDPASGNANFAYEDGDEQHRVWMLDAASGWNQLRMAHAAGVAGVAIWRLGTEDEGIWKALQLFEGEHPPELARLRSVANVDVEGSGEILRIESGPTTGRRNLGFDSHGMIIDERYGALPTPYVVRRTGDHPRSVALTFDDGPDPTWTPAVLKVLREKQVPATFFIIGENAVSHPFLINQIIDEGHELGSHTFTHPDVSAVSADRARLELNVTQRLVQAYTGRSMRLFRAPYFSDAEATSATELSPALIAQEHGYTNVGLHVDPHDWKAQSAASIARSVEQQIEAATPDQTRQIVLLHDSGGDRSQTVAALPRIIDDLRAKGYRFVAVSSLAGLNRADTMPKVETADLLAVRADVGLFLIFAAIGQLIRWIFFIVIVIGVARAFILTAMALYAYAKARATPKPRMDPATFVSVIIPAFNEARVIERSIRRALASRGVRLEVIVVDDGSRDGTADVVQAAFGGNSQVRLVRLSNGGKARALNEALPLAKGDVLIALDADTQFEPDTIARLCRWFADPAIGAVAGNVKVANKINIVTRWQAIEYVTAQNLERRALSSVDSIMVVPGAVGAIRRAALEQAGGYPEDTLAEDQDLTIQIQRDGWRVIYDPAAMAWTEAPESFAALSKQRFRWSFGTLQCLWKHRDVFRERTPPGLAYIGLPQTWLIQIGFALIAPLIDIALLMNIVATVVHVLQHGWEQTQSDVWNMAVYWLMFTAVDAISGFAAYAMEPRRERFPFFLLIAQRLVYRQLMYWVVIRAVMAALRGPTVRWGKLGRTGRVGTRKKQRARALANT